MNRIIGYARMSSHHISLESQLCALKQFGCDKIFIERECSSKSDRKELEKALGSLQTGDTFVTSKLDRLSSSTRHLLTLLNYLKDNEINFISIENNIDTRTPLGKYFFTIMSAFAEMEADLIRERILTGIDTAKKNGIQLGRPPVNKNEEKVIEQYLNTKLPISAIAKANHVSRPTVYRYLKNNGIPLRPHAN